MAFEMHGYVTVNQRLKHALEKWPELRVQESPPKLVEAGTQLFIEVTTTVWRTPDDPLPAVASIWEPFPGTTPYTKGSEQPNASTSALGRCLGLMGVHIEAGMATKDEVVLARERSSRDRHPSNTPPDDRAPVGGRALRPVPTTEPDAPPPPAGLEQPAPGARPATEKQVGFLKRLLKEHNVDYTEQDMARWVADSRLCSQKIEQLKEGN